MTVYLLEDITSIFTFFEHYPRDVLQVFACTFFFFCHGKQCVGAGVAGIVTINSTIRA